MKKRLRKHKVNRVGKKLISLVIVFALLIGDIPVSEIVQMIVENLSSLLSFEVFAAAGDPYDRIEYTKHYISGGADTGYILIESWDDLIWYSQSYYNYSLGTVYTTTVEHEKDVLFINFGSNQGNNYNLNGKSYEPIGNDSKPFEGRVIFSNSSAADTFNVPESLFGTISEKVTIKNQTESAVKQIKLTRTGTGNGDVLFAKKVKSDGNSATYAEWNIVFDKFDDSSAVSYAGLIGEIEAGANVRVTFANNSILTKSNLLANATSSDTNGKPVDAGVLCGKMGAGATLTATYSGTNTDYNITSENGNAGGLVGSMGVDSVLTVTASNLQGTSAWVSASNGYAGGIVGKNDGGTVTITPSSGTVYTVSQIIHGKDGTGGLFGYYAPPSSASSELDISKYSLNCKLEQAVSGTGFSGGIIGVIENVPAEPAGRIGGSLTIKGVSDGSTVVTSTHVSQTDNVTGNPTGYKAEAYGGLIGSYKATDTSYSLTVKDIAITATNTLAASVYGGCIGKIIDASYVKFEAFKLNSADGSRSGTFGGLVADSPKGYIYADGSTSNTTWSGIIIGSSVMDGFKGGGLVGNLGDGVLGLNGTINVSNAKPTASDDNGHLVGTRDNALIYAESGWNYSMSDREVDNVGSWGDVIAFGSALSKSDVIDSETNNIITLKTVSTSAINSTAAYALASVLFQIDTSKNSFITTVSQLADNVNLTFTADIDLSGTGLRGITRDCGTSRVEYKGTVNGNDHKITFDIKNVGQRNSTDRPIYRKQYLGLVAVANGATFSSIDYDGSIKSKNGRTTTDAKSVYVGTAAATIKGSVTATDSNTLSGLSISLTGSVSTIAGRLFGEAPVSIGNITVSGCEYDGSITGNTNCTVGGVIGKIAGGASGAVWSFDDVTLKGTVKGVKEIGGLVAVLNGNSVASVKIGQTTAVKTDGITVEGSDAQFMGGLFGYEWKNADVDIYDFKIADTTTAITTVKQTAAGSTAGLACYASGHWTVHKLDLRQIKMLTSEAASVGMIVNRGMISSDGIYLELPSGYDYKLSFADGSAFKSGVVFDEICAYSASSASAIMTNGQGVVSISTTGLTMSDTASDSLSYKNQTVQGKYKNGNTRYYYNLDTIDKDNTLSSTDYAKKLMRWGVRQYACSNIQKYFPDPFSSNTIPTGTYNLQGYSWYPVTPLNAMTVHGTFTFYNKEFDDCEKVKGKHTNISSNDDRNIWSPLESDQHYMMHNGLFYNVNKNLTIGTLSLAGTIGAVDSTSGTGALVYGTVSGSKTDTSTNITTIDSTGTGHSISLAGVKIWNLGDLTGDTVYAPLLINQASDYVTLNIGNVSTTSAYKVTDNGITTTPSAATCLIGKAGTRATASDDNPISQGITVTFSNIALDGRNAEGNTVYDDTRYNTTKSIFTDSTLLWQLIGSSGTYNFAYDSDWGTGTPHNVTYGRELGYTTAGQYPNQELWYQNEKATGGKQRYVRPDTAPPDSNSTQYSGFTDSSPYTFLPYVYNVSTKTNIDNKTEFKYQLMVNHQPSDRIYGCGTYNDPYIITSATDLINISKFINNSSNLTGKINVDYDNDGWCDATDADHLRTEHLEYTLGTTTCTTSDTTKNMTSENMRKYLAGAYYQIRLSGVTEIELASDSGFLGLGTDDKPFHGVVDGGDSAKTIINETAYPFVRYSSGCALRNLSITADSSGLNSNNSYKKYIKLTGYKQTAYTSKTENLYGAVIGCVNGGDNIIDNVQVDLSDLKIWLTGDQQMVPVGGYVGVIINGGVVFRNMSGEIQGLESNENLTSNTAINNETMLDSDNNTWLYVNPIIGRVINGYAVTESSTGYKPREANVTMKNSTGDNDVVKHYSITDISTSAGNLSVSSSTITVPDSQGLFFISLIVNSGIGSNLLGYDSAFTKRTAYYTEIGSSEADSSDCDDYDDYAKNDNSSGTAYVISKYAPDCGSIGTGSWAVRLSGTSYELPDGFRGIGNFFYNNNDLRLNVTSFQPSTEGNRVSISLNTKYYYYCQGVYNSADNKKKYEYSSIDYNEYRPHKDSQTSGLGLFNHLNSTCTFKNITLSGKVDSDAIDQTTGNHLVYQMPNMSNGYLSAGMLAGTVVNDAITLTITNVKLDNVNVRSALTAGGLIGNTGGTSGKYFKIAYTTNVASDNITVHAGNTAGGFIGRIYHGYVDIDFGGYSFNINEVVDEAQRTEETQSGSSYNENSGAGGFIGIIRTNTTSYSNKIKNVVIGSSSTTQKVECMQTDTEHTNKTNNIYTGGVVGSLNKSNALTMENCTFYNFSVNSQHYSGGLVGYAGTNSYPTIKNVHFISNNDSVISGVNYAGGLVGYTKQASDGGETMPIIDCSINGYIISANTAGGVIAERGAKNNSQILRLENFRIVDCTVKGSAAAGGFAGILHYPLYGYNILAKNLDIKPLVENGSITKKGYLVAQKDSDTNAFVKIVGFSRQEVLCEGESSSMVQEMIGGGSSNATNYGTGGYVIFADYLGTASYTESNGTITPGANSSASFSNMTSNTNVAPAAPYVTTSPMLDIANKNSVMQFLLSDGASPLTSAAVGHSTQAFADIYDDISNSNAGYFQIPSSYLDTDDEYKEYTTKISSFKTEMGDKLADGIDFPVLVLDKINKGQMTDFINHYINLLTNTSGTYNFASNASNVASIYSVDIYKVTFNSDGNAISTIGTSECCLKNANDQFYIESDDTDTAASTAQFTLMDVKFKDPSDTGTVAYHLYIPCYVRKLLEYDFDIHIDSGTSYDINNYTQLVENNLVENIGTPVTLEFAFTYQRTAAEWTDAVNGGDSLLSNYPKSLLFDNATTISSGSKPNFPEGTKMVLIDTQNNSRAYYLDGLNNTSFTPSGDFRTLNFSSFTDINSTAFTPVCFNDMLNVSVAEAADGTLVPDNTNAIVKDTTTGTKYRAATEAEKTNNSIQKYSATVTFKNVGDTALSEHYFLTIYTPYSTTDVVYHYIIQAKKDLGTSPYPSRITAESEGNVVHLYTGYIYDNNVYIDSLKVGGVDNNAEITAENNSIEATIHAEIGLTTSGEENIRSTLSGNSPPDIFQSFLIKLNKDGNVGLAAASAVSVENYTIGGRPVTDLKPSWTSSDYTDIRIPSYIEMRNGVPLATQLSNVSQNGTLNISAKATITFDNDNGDITAQFFPQTAEKYTTLIAYSNIASSSDSTASSNVSASADTTVGGNKPQYYTKLEEKAILNYDALDILADGSNLPQLGINANDPKDAKKLPAPIKTVASYNVENCQAAWQAANYLKLEIELKSKYDNYTASLNIFDYIQQSTFSIFDGEIDSNDINTAGTTSTKLVYIIHKDDLEDFYNDKVYRIPIEFNVYSGSGADNNFESQNRQYSNYGIFINVSMLQAEDSSSAVVGTEPETTNNYVKYTNARIYIDKINAGKSWSSP